MKHCPVGRGGQSIGEYAIAGMVGMIFSVEPADEQYGAGETGAKP